MPNFSLPRLTGISVLMAFSLSACATVDVSAIGAAKADPILAETVDKGNVITRTVKRLYQVFTDKGWYEDTSRQRVQSAANILLNGLQTSDGGIVASSRGAALSTAALMDDIKTARYHIVQTTKAAEVYLDIASSDANLVDELKQLQKALRVSEKAQFNFSESDVSNSQTTIELSGLKNEVETLRRVTDDFGSVVRARRIAASSAEAS